MASDMARAGSTETFPPPWALRGEGLMLFYRFPAPFVLHQGFIPAGMADSFLGLVGCVMLVDYRQSPVGPYRELLFIPGLFRTARGRRFSITRIFVDSAASMDWGRRNWGIPKEMAQFSWKRTGPASEQVLVESHAAGGRKQPMLEVAVKGIGPRFPISTALIPLRLQQRLNGKVYEVSPRGKGMGQWASASGLQVLSADFPDISLFRPFAALRVSNFQMEFPPGREWEEALPGF